MQTPVGIDLSTYAEKEIFLTREGEVEGPFSSMEIEELRRSGELLKYFWFWDGSTPNWIPANPPPPLPSREAIRARTATASSIRPLRVICHDFRQLISSTLCEVAETHCTLAMNSGASGGIRGNAAHKAALPPLRVGMALWLSILDETTGCAESVQGSVSRIFQVHGEWRFRVEWAGVPEILRT